MSWSWIIVGGLLVSFAQADDTSNYARKAMFLDIEIQGKTHVAVGEHGLILRADTIQKNSNISSSKQTFDWQVSASNTSKTLTAISALNDNTWFAVGHSSTLLISKDSGKNWQEKIIADADPLAPWLDVLTVAPSTVLLVGAYGQSALSVDAGKTWQLQPLTEDAEFHLNAAKAFDASHWIVVGEAGQIYATKNAGVQWENINSPYEGSFFEIQQINDDQILIAGLRGHAFVGSGFAKWKAEQSNPVVDEIPVEESQIINSENSLPIASENISEDIIQWQSLPINEVETWFGSAVLKNDSSTHLILAGSRGSIIDFPLKNMGTTNSYTIKKTVFNTLSSIAIDSNAQIFGVGSATSLQPEAITGISMRKETP